ncbi:MAG TPA: dihydrofolate reductase family protein [Candidatus Corynebacterium avicola]|uniref:Dihydrofolate reductase family protein n=1 Tax=Candidatus Corynebacterium avicola TaxID=2838527 RepID=A0A9D1RLD0_9CORY|nr:dihydrofolate reductase family protein [Candidatus Corynebacterium avicola]
MGRLIYSMICSADGYVADEEGRFDDWARPDEQVLETINQDMSDVGTYLYGRRMYEMMTVWETDPDLAADSPESEVFARDWQAKEKIVYSTTLPEVVTSRTRLERQVDAEEVRAVKEATDKDLTVDGPTLAAEMLRLSLVDEVHMVVCPVLIGGGLRMFPEVRIPLRLVHERRFDSGMVQLRYVVD